MDYYGPMELINRFRTTALSLTLAVSIPSAWAQSASVEKSNAPFAPKVENSVLDAELFYEIFLGELNTRTGDPGTGYALLLEAARRTGDGQLYQRSTDIALQSRSAEHALVAARAWRAAHPESRAANRYALQILIALNRIGETAPLLKQELEQSTEREKASTLAALPQMYGRASDKKLALSVVESALTNELTNTATGALAWTSLGFLRWANNDQAGALDALQQSLTRDSSSTSAARLALALMEAHEPMAEPLVLQMLASPHAVPELRMAYVRVLLNLQRYIDARKQLEKVTHEKPDLGEAWIALATLQVQENQLSAAENSLQQYSALTAPSVDPEERRRSSTQAYLLHSQIAEKQKNYAAAESWLARIDNPRDNFTVQSRRAMLLARQGKLAEARTLLQNVPGNSPDAQRMKLLAEVQLLRELNEYAQAYQVQARLAAQAPGDMDLVYEQAMLAEKAGMLDMMENLLRQIIAQNPQYHHAYNALGFSMAERGISLPEAKQLIVKALELAPNDPFITDSLGWVEFRLGNLHDAKKHLQTAYQIRPDVEIAAHLGEVLWTLGEKAEAMSVWKEAERLYQGNDALKSTLNRLGVSL